MRSLLRIVCLLASTFAIARADVTVDFNTGSSQFADNFVVGSASDVTYSASGGAGIGGGMISTNGAPSAFLYDPGTGARTLASDTLANGVQSGNFTIGWDFKVSVTNDSVGVWFYDGATEGATRPSGNALLLLLNVNATNSSERVRWWTGGTTGTAIGTAQRDFTPTGTNVTTGTWYHAEVALVKTGTSLTATFTVWDQARTTQLLTDTNTFTGITATGGQIGFRYNSAGGSNALGFDYLTLGAAPLSGDPGTGGTSAEGPGNTGGSIGGSAPTTPAAPPVFDVERRFPTGTVIDPTQAPYNADKTGSSDATAALQAALDAAANRIVWLPTGTYKISGTLRFPNATDGVHCHLIGQSRTGTILRLANASTGFTNIATPKAMLFTGLADGKSNPDAFGRFVENLTFDTGSGNPGAIALSFYTNNLGAARDLLLRSGDGQGYSGLDLGTVRNNGPLLVQRIRVEGFGYGITSGQQYGLGATLEHVTLTGQSLAGIYNQNQQLALRNVHTSAQAGPSLWNTTGHVTLVEGSFTAAPAGATQPAVKNGAAGRVLLRQIVSSGYQKVVDDPSFPVTGTFVNEWLSNASNYLFATTGRTLNLPITETPAVAYDDPATWVNVTSAPYNCRDSNLNNNYDNAAGLQAAIDSGASTLFIPAGLFIKVKSPVFIRGNVKRIIGLGGAGLVGDGSMSTNNLGPAFILGNGTAGTVAWENLGGGSGTTLHFDNRSTRSLVIRDSGVQGGDFTGAGDVFFEGVSSNPFCGFIFRGGGRVFARQLNPENSSTKITASNGTRFWNLGLKTEKAQTVLDLSGNSRAEILGAFLYPIESPGTEPMFKISDSRASFDFFEYLYGSAYGTLVAETQAGVARTLLRGAPTYPAAYERVSGAGFGSELTLYTTVDVLTGLSIAGNGNAIANGDLTPSTADHTDFGTAQSGLTTVTRSFTVQNLGDAALNFTTSPRLALSGPNAADFSVSADLPATLAPGASATATITFNPAAIGNRTATVSLAYGSGAGPFTFALGGTGGAPAPVATFSPAVLDFAVAVGTTGTASFQIKNEGYGPLTGTFERNTGDTWYAARSGEPGGPPDRDWVDITSPTSLPSNASAWQGYVDDTITAALNLPFPFPFYGTSYTRFNLTSNGYFGLATGPNTFYSSSFNNGALPTTTALYDTPAAILPYWDDLYLRSGTGGIDTTISYGLATGDPATFVITCANISFYNSALATKFFTFQTLLGADGSVQFNYQTLATNSSYTVGLQKNTTTGLQLYNGGQAAANNVGNTHAAVSAGQSILLTPASAWITGLTPTTGTALNLAARSSQAGTLTTSASGLTAGRTYRSLIRLRGSNDPARPLVWLPVYLRVTATALEAWRYNTFGLTTATGTAANLADPDGDGINNLLEYALGGNPLSAADADATRPLTQVAASRLQISFLRARAEVSYIVEASGDLTTWTPVSYTPVSIGQTQTVADTVDITSASRRFLRLKITTP